MGRGGGDQISNFSEIQKSPNHPRGGGVKKIVDFFLFLGHFLFVFDAASPKIKNKPFIAMKCEETLNQTRSGV